MTNFRALCAELTDALDTWLMAHHYGGVPPQDGADAKLVLRAKVALSQPTDEEILRIAAKTIEPYETRGIAVGEYEPETKRIIEVYGSELIAFARAVLDRWGQDQQNKETVND